MRRVIISFCLILAAISGYLVADAYDIVPGFVTLKQNQELSAPVYSIPNIEPDYLEVSENFPVSYLDADAPIPDKAVLQQYLDELVADKRSGSSVGAILVDYQTGEVLAQVNADDPQVTASTMKLLTGVTGLERLGRDYQFPTKVFFDRATGTLTVKAGGDMLLTAGYGHQDISQKSAGYAGVSDLVEQIIEAIPNIKFIPSLTLKIDDLVYPPPYFPHNWPSYAFEYGYAGPVSGLAIDAGRIPAQGNKRYDDPAVAVLLEIQRQLVDQGVSSLVEPSMARGVAIGDEIAEVLSAPLWKVTQDMLHVSDNSVAEVIFREVARARTGSADQISAQETQSHFLSTSGLDTEGLVINDGAGYADDNQVTPRLFADAIRFFDPERGSNGIVRLLPLSGLEGTVYGRYAGTDLAGAIRAKTGSLNNVTTLTGVVMTDSGRLLVFATLLDKAPFAQAPPKAAIDEMLAKVAACGCEG